MKLFRQVAIVGTGLIGGSLALAMRRHALAGEILGVSRHKESLALAKRNGVIDRGSQYIDILKDADLVILATPIHTILDLARPISKIIRADCIVMDVGSTKERIVSELEDMFPCYVGSHPLAGSEKRGVINANSGIFKDSLCILTPTAKTDKRSLNKIKNLWIKIGARVAMLNPGVHDKILSFVSHLPHISAFSLMSLVPRDCLKFASTGLKDTTRIAASDSAIWADIFLTNSKNVLTTIKLFEDKLSKIQNAIRKQDRDALISILEAARKKRQALV